MTELAAKTVWITGASSGIGRELALQANAAGANVVLSARRAEELEAVRAACQTPAQARVLVVDLLDPALDFDALAAQATECFGGIDILVNNAGLSQRSLLKDTAMPVYRRLMELDYFVPVALTRAVLPAMIARGSGHLVAISSVAGKLGVPLRSGYCAAKHALHGFYDAARAELHDAGIRVSIVCPGFVQTQVSVNALGADGSAHGSMDEAIAGGISAELCAHKVWAAVINDVDEVVIGRERVAVWLKRLFPGLLSRMIRRAKVS